MSNKILAMTAAAVLSPLLVACSESAAPNKPDANLVRPTEPAADDVARLDTLRISRPRFNALLVEAYGLQLLTKMMLVEMTQRVCAEAGVVVSEQDVLEERRRSVDAVFEQRNAADLKLLAEAVSRDLPEQAAQIRARLDRQNERELSDVLRDRYKLTRTEFELTVRANAYTRKLASSRVKITDEMINAEFNALYGERVYISHIECTNMLEINAAKVALAAKDADFAEVARRLSRNPGTAAAGGVLDRPFTRQSEFMPEAVRALAFSLKPGEVSDAINVEGAYHLIRLDRREPPKYAKLDEPRRVEIRQRLLERMVPQESEKISRMLAERARKDLVISDPVLAAQFRAAEEQYKQMLKDQEEKRQQVQAMREAAATRPATVPATSPATVPAR